MRDRKLSVPTKLAYGIGQIGESIKSNTFEYFLLFYYVQVLHLNPALAGLALFLALLVDAVTDPAVGAISDNVATRLGRRHPFIYGSAIPFGLFLWLIFTPPTGLGEWGLFAWLVFFAIGVRVAMTFFLVPYYALGAELTENHSERTVLVAYRQMFAFLGALVVTALAFRVFFSPTPDFPQGQLDPAAYPAFALTFAIIGAAVIILSALGTQNQIPFLHAAGTNQSLTSINGYGKILRDLMRNRSFLSFFLLCIMFFVILGTQRALALHINTYYWELTGTQIQMMFYALFGATILSIPAAKYVIEWLDKKNTIYLLLPLTLAAYIVPVTLRLLGWFPENGSPMLFPLLIASQLIAGAAVGPLVVVTGAMVADIADDHDLRTHSRQEGLLFGFFNFASKATSGLGQLLAGITLSLVAFPTKETVFAGEVPAETLFHLGMIYGPGLAIFGLLTIYPLRYYDITRKQHEKTLRELAQRRDTGSDAA
jgi:Na+/melibiose symporter-like transporter